MPLICFVGVITLKEVSTDDLCHSPEIWVGLPWGLPNLIQFIEFAVYKYLFQS